jgi:HAD superfamily hydrolase (TIGR01549 family)
VRIRAVSLDLFDTLVDLHMDRLPLVEISGRRIPSTYGLLHAASLQWHGLDFERFAAELGQNDREGRDSHYAVHRELPTLERFKSFARRVGVGDEAMAEALTRVHMAEIRRQATHLAHHPELLARLRGRAKLAVCSNFSHGETARAVLEDAGLARHFDAIVISDEGGFRKPRAEIFAAVAERLGVDPAEILHVGDNLEADVGGAAGAGMSTAWLTRRVKDPAAARAAWTGPAPGLEIADLAELEAKLS